MSNYTTVLLQCSILFLQCYVAPTLIKSITAITKDKLNKNCVMKDNSTHVSKTYDDDNELTTSIYVSI